MKLSRWFALALAPLLATAGTVIATAGPANAWTPKTPPMTTPWTNSVPTANPLPEYPRPQLTRTDWQNLNGIWEFAVTGSGQSSPPAARRSASTSSCPTRSSRRCRASSAVTENRHALVSPDLHRPGRLGRPPAAAALRRGRLADATVCVNGTQVGTHTAAATTRFTSTSPTR